MSVPAIGDPVEAREKLLALPHADIARLVGSWQVKEMEPNKMVYEFQAGTFAMHGLSSGGGTTPNTIAAVVIRIGRKRMPAAS